MKAAPAITNIEILDNFILKIKFEGMEDRYVDLGKFPLLGIAKRLLTDPGYLSQFKIEDGVPEWEGKCLLGPEDLLKHSTTEKPAKTPIASSYSKKIQTFKTNCDV